MSQGPALATSQGSPWQQEPSPEHVQLWEALIAETRANAKRLCDIDRGHHGGNVSNPNARDARRGHSGNAPMAGFVIPKLTKEQRKAEHTVAGSTTTEGAEYEVPDPRTGTIITITDLRALEFKNPEFRDLVEEHEFGWPTYADRPDCFRWLWNPPLVPMTFFDRQVGKQLLDLLCEASNRGMQNAPPPELIFAPAARRKLSTAMQHVRIVERKEECAQLLLGCDWCGRPAGSWCEGPIKAKCNAPIYHRCENLLCVCRKCMPWVGMPLNSYVAERLWTERFGKNCLQPGNEVVVTPVPP